MMLAPKLTFSIKTSYLLVSRTEAVEESNIDFFVVVRGLPKELVRRRYMVYDALAPVLRRFNHTKLLIE